MRTTRVLFVEDDVATREALVEALATAGYQVDGAASAAEGLRSLRRARYELVVTDFSMPGSTGTAMLEQAAEEGLLEGCKALLITAHQPDNPSNVEVLRKPLDLRQFLQRVEELVNPAATARPLRAIPESVNPRTKACFVDADALERMDDRTRRLLATRVTELYRRGTALYSWSTKGTTNARRFAETLGIANCFMAFLPKPTMLISSTPISEWDIAEHSSAQMGTLTVEQLLAG